MSGFRGSRRLMARINEIRRLQQFNKRERHRFTPEEATLRANLNAEAAQGFSLGETRLVKQAPKHDG